MSQNAQVVEGFHGLLFPKFSSDALIRALTDLSSTSIGRLTRIANNIALSGRLLAKNILASECVTGYANLLEEVLNFPSDVILPGSITQLPEAVWEWDLFWNELIQVSPNEQHDESVKKKPSVVIKLEEEFSDLVSPLNISNPEKEILLHDIPTQQDWDIIGEIERTEEYDRVEMEEVCCYFSIFTCLQFFMALTFLRARPYMISYVASRKNRKYIRFMGTNIS